MENFHLSILYLFYERTKEKFNEIEILKKVILFLNKEKSQC
jgi:hypothetical protein